MESAYKNQSFARDLRVFEKDMLKKHFNEDVKYDTISPDLD